jgi:hypothetical protein
MYLINIKKKIYKYFIFLSLYFLNIALRINNHILAAFILRLNITKFNKISRQNKKIKKILVFPKSGGNEDLIEAFRNDTKNNINFFLLQRFFLKEIFHFYFKNTNKSKYHSDYKTKTQTKVEVIKKELFIQFLTKTFNILNNFFKLDGFLSFNLFYYNEKYLEEVCKNLNMKFIILQKESVFTPNDEKGMPKIYRNYNDKSLAHKILVYSKSQKKLLIKSKIANKNQIIVNGCARSDYAFKLRKITPKEKNIIFYLIDDDRGTNAHLNINVRFNNLLKKTLNYLKYFAIKNPDIKVILKGKTGVHSKKKLYTSSFPKNCIFVEGGSGEKFLENASLVIAFNSTIVFETILANRNLIIPNFNNEYKTKRQFLHNINEKYLVSSKTDFLNKIKFYLKLKYKNKKLTKYDKKIIDYYLGNSDGKSGKRLKKNLNNEINK